MNRLLKAPEAAKVMNISYGYFRRLMLSDDHPPFYDFGKKCRRFDEGELLDWIESRKRTSGADSALDE